MQLLETRRGKRPANRWKKLGWLTGAVVLGLLLWKGGEAAMPRYHRWKQNRALVQAKEFIAKKDAPNAQLALEVAMREVPGNPDTIRVAAEMLEQVNAPQAMRLRRAVVQIVPDSAEDAAALVLCCIKFRDFNAARDALSAASPTISAQAPMLRAALTFAVATDNSPVADALFKHLGTESPDDPELKVAHAILLLRHPREEVRQKARLDLEAAAQRDPKLRFRLNREFAGEALQRKDYADARAKLTLVLADPEAAFSDRLQKANLDLLIEQKDFGPIFGELSPYAAKDESSAAQFVQWLLVQNRAVDADRWIGTLPQNLQASRAVRAGQTDAVVQLKDWDRLQRLVTDGAWGNISKESLQLAFAAKIVDSPSKPTLRRDTWDLALTAAGSNLGSLAVLQRLAAAWRWDDESERTLWAIAKISPDQTWAYQTLFNVYRQKKNTSGMRDVMASLKNFDGLVPRYQHDWAVLSLLMEPTTSWTPAKETLKKLSESEPTDPTYLTSYAFALAQSGKGAEAFAVTEKLTSDQRSYLLRQPYLAFVYGVAKKAAEFEHTVSAGAGGNFLPEESYLFTRGREELERKADKPKIKADAAAKS